MSSSHQTLLSHSYQQLGKQHYTLYLLKRYRRESHLGLCIAELCVVDKFSKGTRWELTTEPSNNRCYLLFTLHSSKVSIRDRIYPFSFC